MSALVSRLEAVADRLEKVGATGGGGGGGDGGDNAASVEAFDEIVGGSFKAFIEKTMALGDEAAQIAPLVQAAFGAQREFLVMASKSQKPSAAELGPLLAETSTAMGAVSAFKEKNFKSKQGNHLSGMAESMGVLGWVTFDKPCPYIKETTGSAQFYTNRVIKDFKESDKSQVEWARSLTTVLTELHDFVKQFHTTGVTWNANGSKASAPASAPKPTPVAAAPKVAKNPAGGFDLSAALNKGGGVTSGLKKVDKSQMNHKNPDLVKSSMVSADAIKKPVAKAKVFGAAAVKKEPVLALNGKKWAVEFQENNKDIVINTDGTGQVLYVYKCTGSTIQVKGKINAITLDGCKKCAIVFDTCVAAFELINCNSVQVQVIEKVKTISIDKTDGCQVYLSKDCLDAEIVSAKSSEMNVSIPIGADGEFVEMALPEQYKTTFNSETKKLFTEPTDIAS